jgi:hypothetical protein
MTRFRNVLTTLLLALAVTPTARAATIVLDASNGAAHDAVGDGWFFGPLDGVGDAGGNPLGVGYIAGTLELRALSEFPLAPLAGLTSADVESATLTVTIDDVLSTFGPGAAFDGTASDPIAAYHYPADGTVTVADFAPAGLENIGFLTPGLITDASLVSSGAVVLTLDATSLLQDALDAGDAAFGVLLGTNDSPTGTSLDNLSPPGVSGGQLPFITIETVELTAPVLSSAAQGCQGAIAKAAGKLIAAELKAFASCFGLVLRDVEKTGTPAANTVTACAGQLDAASPTSKLGKALAKFDTKTESKCAAVTPADLGSPCDAGAADIAATIACVRGGHLTTGQQLVDSQYAGACELIDAVGLSAAFPELCS